jgi:phosphoribosylcarboxyaminoimidazole (NCAIR) mutase
MPKCLFPYYQMTNLLGTFDGPYRFHIKTGIPPPNTFVYDYGKSTSRPFRKLGHVTAMTRDEDSRIDLELVTVEDATQTPLKKIAIIMGSRSDFDVMKQAASTLLSMGIPYEMSIVSAHRTPDRLKEYATSAYKRGIRVIIAGAGGAAHLPGMVAAFAPGIPVIGVPVYHPDRSDGMDALLSIVQMPPGVC